MIFPTPRIFLLSRPRCGAGAAVRRGRRTARSQRPAEEGTSPRGRRARPSAACVRAGGRAPLESLEGKPGVVACLRRRIAGAAWWSISLDQDGESVARALLFEARPGQAGIRDAGLRSRAARGGSRGARGRGGGLGRSRRRFLRRPTRAALDAADGRFVLVAGVVRRVGEGRASLS